MGVMKDKRKIPKQKSKTKIIKDVDTFLATVIILSIFLFILSLLIYSAVGGEGFGYEVSMAIGCGAAPLLIIAVPGFLIVHAIYYIKTKDIRKEKRRNKRLMNQRENGIDKHLKEEEKITIQIERERKRCLKEEEKERKRCLKEEEQKRKAHKKVRLANREYKRKCNNCQTTWHSLLSRERTIEKNIRVNTNIFGGPTGCSACCGTPSVKRSEEEILTNLRRCPNCKSRNYSEEIVSYVPK